MPYQMHKWLFSTTAKLDTPLADKKLILWVTTKPFHISAREIWLESMSGLKSNTNIFSQNLLILFALQ
jgi:hypothetical protein